MKGTEQSLKTPSHLTPLPSLRGPIPLPHPWPPVYLSIHPPLPLSLFLSLPQGLGDQDLEAKSQPAA